MNSLQINTSVEKLELHSVFVSTEDTSVYPIYSTIKNKTLKSIYITDNVNTDNLHQKKMIGHNNIGIIYSVYFFQIK